MSYLEQFKSDKWDNLSYSERISALQQAENAQAAKQGRPARKVKGVDMEPGVRGHYNMNYPEYIQVNRDMVNASGEARQNYDMLSTVYHEGRHAYQDDAIKGKIQNPKETPETVQSWKKNYPNLGGVYYDGETKGSYQDYRYQPIEADANDYAAKEMASHKASCGTDPSFKKYEANTAFWDGINSDIAKQDYGPQYKEAIRKKINKEYNQKYGSSKKMESVSNKSETGKTTGATQNAGTGSQKSSKFKKGYKASGSSHTKTQSNGVKR